jgi:S1-C subfamily serine protease
MFGDDSTDPVLGKVVIDEILDSNGQAVQCGLQKGDCLYRWGGNKIESTDELGEIVNRLQQQQTPSAVDVVVRRRIDRRTLPSSDEHWCSGAGAVRPCISVGLGLDWLVRADNVQWYMILSRV